MNSMEAMLLSYLKDAAKPAGLFDLAEALQLDAGELTQAMGSLKRQGLVAETKKHKYALPEQIGLTVGRVMTTSRGLCFARPASGGEDFLLDLADDLPLNGDLVLLRKTEGGGRPRGELVEVLTRAHPTLTASLTLSPVRGKPEKSKGGRKKTAKKKPEGALYAATAQPTDRHLQNLDIDIGGELMGAGNGDLVLLRVVRWPSRKKHMVAEVMDVLGPAQDVSTQLRALVLHNGLAQEFSEAALKQARSLPEEVAPGDLAGRRDLRGLCTFTIDGADAKDFDDAVSLTPTQTGWRLGVHIADVSHYVTPGCAIDRDAQERGTSVYLPGLTLPMLPEALSNRLCSLMPDVDRLTLSCIMELEDGRVTSYAIEPSVIHSSARLVYDDVNRMLKGEPNAVPEALHPVLRDMVALSGQLRALRHQRGSIDFDLAEPDIQLDADGRPVGITARERGAAHLMIEDFMLLANETVARHARERTLPFLYRVHEHPDPDRLHALEVFLNGLNIRVHLGAEPHPSQLQRILAQVEGTPEAGVVAQVMLRSLKRARYSELPQGHFGLAAQDYCHFTSPIRRYPDLAVHRMLKLEVSGGMERKAHEQWELVMPALAAQCSALEYAATQAEREADDLMRAHYMSDHIGEEFDGIVSGVTAWGFYVALPNTVEGLVHVSTLRDHYTLNETQFCLVGEHKRKLIRLGDKMRVRVDRVDLSASQINFVALQAL